MKPLKLPLLSKKPSLFNIFLCIIIIIGICITIIIINYTLQPSHIIPPESQVSGVIDITSNNTITPYMSNFSNSFNQKTNGIKLNIVGEKNDDIIFNSVNVYIANAGILIRNLTANESESGFNQTLIAYYYNNTTKIPVILITKGEPSGDLKIFINFTLSSEGQSVLAKNGLIPLNNSSITA